MLDRLSTVLVRRARLVLVITLLAVIAAVGVGVRAFGLLQTGGQDDPSSQSRRAAGLIDARFGGSPNLLFLVRARSGTVDTPAVAAAGQRLTADLSRARGVSSVQSYWPGRVPQLKAGNGRSALVTAHLGDDDRASALVDRFATTTGAARIQAGGDEGFNHDLGPQIGKSLGVAEGIAVPVVLILLLFVFGSLVSALLPPMIGGIAIAGTFAELFILGNLTAVSIYSVNLTTALGLGLGIDYALLIVSRFREQLAAGQDVPDAVRHTVRTAGRTILFSAATVAAALAALLVFPQFFLRSFAYAGIGVVLVAAVAAVVVTPALLAVLGPRVNAGRIPGVRADRGAAAPMWGTIAARVMRRPALTAIPVVVVLLVLASPLVKLTFGTPDDRVARRDVAARQVGDTLRSQFSGGESNTIDVVTTGPLRTAAYAAQLSRLDNVSQVDSSAGVFADGQRRSASPDVAALARPGAQRLTVSSTADATSGAAARLVGDIRVITPPGGAALVGGTTAELVDTKHSIGSRLWIAVPLVVLTTFILLFLFTGSIVQPLRALVLSALSLGATLGILVWIFQEGHLSSLLGFAPRPIDTAMTVLTFCIAFGLSMDYEVFLTSRIKELHDGGADTTEAVTSGLAHTGRIVTTAAGLLAVSFFAFGTATVSFLQMFGIGTGIAILLDATLIRGVLVPAVNGVLGERGWYAPRALRRVHTRLALGDTP